MGPQSLLMRNIPTSLLHDHRFVDKIEIYKSELGPKVMHDLTILSYPPITGGWANDKKMSKIYIENKFLIAPLPTHPPLGSYALHFHDSICSIFHGFRFIHFLLHHHPQVHHHSGCQWLLYQIFYMKLSKWFPSSAVGIRLAEGHRSEVMGRRSDVKAQRSRVKGQGSKVRGQWSKVRIWCQNMYCVFCIVAWCSRD